MARSFASCSCLALSVFLGLGGLGLGLAWFNLPGEGFQGKLTTLLESMMPVEFEVVETVATEGGGLLVTVEARPVDDFDVTSLEIGAVVPESNELFFACDVATDQPMFPGREPVRFDVAVEPVDEGLESFVMSFDVGVRAVKNAGSTKVSLNLSDSVTVWMPGVRPESLAPGAEPTRPDDGAR